MRGWRKRGTRCQGLGRSRGGFPTKIHLHTNAHGLPISLTLTPGEAHDSTAYSVLMEERQSDPGTLLADHGYDSDAIRQDVRDRGGQPEIPTKRNRPIQPSVQRPLYVLRNRIERCINRLKKCRRVAATVLLFTALLGLAAPAALTSIAGAVLPSRPAAA
ncbi:IS5 family transposase [Teichococcus oryzae]|uniref:IS5 family transposase n=1 Tax=Teichococcus oryzae TaxID=1608942 RepID=A0A5B2TCY3_9PROT|nr:IS5 family transposase [Pseudoroseomonas oryzae]KAA2211640.1 IS5 family transposase [Pseudoroseomonas oryzae]